MSLPQFIEPKRADFKSLQHQIYAVQLNGSFYQESNNEEAYTSEKGVKSEVTHTPNSQSQS